MKQSSISLVLTLTVLIVMSVSANGAVVSYSASVPLSTTDWTRTVNLPQFDPSLGVLNSAEVSFAGLWISTFKFETLDGGGRVTFICTPEFTMTGPGVSADVTGGDVIFFQNTLVETYDGVTDFEGPDSLSKTLQFGVMDTSTIATGDLGAFIGTGLLDFTASTITWSMASLPGGHPVAQQTTVAGADFSVSYDYTVPEPGSLSVLGSALLGMLALARRRRG